MCTHFKSHALWDNNSLVFLPRYLYICYPWPLRKDKKLKLVINSTQESLWKEKKKRTDTQKSWEFHMMWCQDMTYMEVVGQLDAIISHNVMLGWLIEVDWTIGCSKETNMTPNGSGKGTRMDWSMASFFFTGHTLFSQLIVILLIFCFMRYKITMISRYVLLSIRLYWCQILCHKN